MKKTTRRNFIQGALAGGLSACALQGGMPRLRAAPRNSNDVKIEEVSVSFEDFDFRTPFKFAGVVVTRQRMATVRCSVRTESGKSATGFAILPHNYTFTYPSKKMSPDDRLTAMKALSEELVKVTANHAGFGHPIELNFELAAEYLEAAARVSQKLNLAEPIPKLCTLVVAAAFDAAIHDAYGKVHGKSAFCTLNGEFMPHDLSRFLGADFRGEYPDMIIRSQPLPQMPICHTVSSVDPLVESDVTEPLSDGLPVTLGDWIDWNGLTYLKLKFNGTDLKWDVERMLDIERVTGETQRKRGVTKWAYVPDFNEKCPNVDYYLEFLRKVREQSPTAFARIEYVEQPTHRDLVGHPENDMHEAAQLCPVVIDESVTDADSVLLAKKLGWTGIVVKSPKGLTHMILMAAVASKHGLHISGGDMSCPGAAFIQTANFQARLPGVTNIEANSRQILPQANQPWEDKFPGMFHVKDGLLQTGDLVGPGLGV